MDSSGSFSSSSSNSSAVAPKIQNAPMNNPNNNNDNNNNPNDASNINNSHNAQLREKEARIRALERVKQQQNEELTILRSEVGKSQIKHNEEMYWLRLECDSLRRDKENLEERMTEFQRDLRDLKESASQDEFEDMMDGGSGMITGSNNNNSSSSSGFGYHGPGGNGNGGICTDPQYVKHLQQQLSKSMQTMGILDNQISMVKTSCDEVVQSLKEEIADVMEDKCRMEMELMNQLAMLDNEKREMNLSYDEKFQIQNDKIQHLEERLGDGNGSTKSSSSSHKDKEGEKQPQQQQQDHHQQQVLLDTLVQDKKNLENQLVEAKLESNDALAHLEEINTELEAKVKSLEQDLVVLREKGGSSTAEAMQVLDSLTLDRQETLSTLERVALIWERADDSVQNLEDIIDQLKPHDDDEEEEDDDDVSRDDDNSHDGNSHSDNERRKKKKNKNGSVRDDDALEEDRERLLSTMETAALVHGQIKVALLLIELKLRNQLSSLKNDKLKLSESSGGGGPGDDELDPEMMEKVKEIQQEAVCALEQVEDSLTEQIQELKDQVEDQQEEQRHLITLKQQELRSRDTTSTLMSLEEQKQTLEQEHQEKLVVAVEEAVSSITLKHQDEQTEIKAQLQEANDLLLKMRKEKLMLSNQVETLQEITNRQKEEFQEKEDALQRELASGGGGGGTGGSDLNLSRSVLDRLQNEILVVVQRVKEKNDTIGRLTTTIEEQKVRETALKKEMKRMLKKQAAAQQRQQQQVTASS